jgi:hypothetical protein
MGETAIKVRIIINTERKGTVEQHTGMILHRMTRAGSRPLSF